MNLNSPPDNKKKAFSEKNLTWSLLTLAWPAMIAMVFQSMSSVSDVFFLGRINNPNAQAALGFYGVLTGYLSAYNAIVGNGSVCVIAQYYGAGKIKEAGQATVQTIIMKLFGSLILALPFIILLRPLMMLFGAQGEALDMAVQYGRILLLVFPLHNTGFTFNTALRASGDSLTPMYLMLSTLLINLCFNVLFILGIGPFPKLGILGVAYSTALAQIYLLVAGLWVYTRGKKTIQFSLYQLFIPHFPTMKKIFNIGLPTGFQGLVGGLANSIMVRIIALYGMQVVAGFIVVSRAASLSGMLISGLSFATSAIVGQNMGANRPDRSYQATITAAWIAAIITSLFFILFSLFPEPVLRIFSQDLELLKQFSPLLPLFAFLQITGALASIFGAPLLGTGYLKVSLYVSLVTTWIFQLPGMYLLGKYYGQNGLWISFVITSVVNLYLIALVFKKKNWMSKVI